VRRLTIGRIRARYPGIPRTTTPRPPAKRPLPHRSPNASKKTTGPPLSTRDPSAAA